MTNLIKVLIIDDDPTIQRVVSAFLERYFKELNLTFNIELSDDSFTCVFDLHDHGNKFDLILLDFHLPQIDGVGIFNSVLFSHPELLQRIIFLTGNASELESNLANHQTKILAKPFNFEEFCSAISSTLLDVHASTLPQ